MPLVIAIILGAVADTASGEVSEVRALDCARSSDDSLLSEPDDPEKGFLCAIRDDAFDRGVPEPADMPDRELLTCGHRLRDLAVENEGDVEAPAVSKAIEEAGGRSLVAALRSLRPEVDESGEVGVAR